MDTETKLVAEYQDWNTANGLNLGSADEHLFDDNLTKEQQNWLQRFCERWERVMERADIRVKVFDADSKKLLSECELIECFPDGEEDPDYINAADELLAYGMVVVGGGAAPAFKLVKI